MLRKDMTKSMVPEMKADSLPTLPDKKSIRQMIREQKKQLTFKEVEKRSVRILDRFYQSSVFKESGKIYTYVNYNQEVQTQLLIARALSLGKQVFVPRVENDDMDFYAIHSPENLSPGAYGILEPGKDCIKDTAPSGLMIMPGLAFDRSGRRIGYGGGFYDRYISRYPDFKKIALCFDFQIFHEIKTEAFDIPVDGICSENEWIIPGK